MIFRENLAVSGGRFVSYVLFSVLTKPISLFKELGHRAKYQPNELRYSVLVGLQRLLHHFDLWQYSNKFTFVN